MGDTTEIVDVDQILTNWAEKYLGQDYTLDSIDTSGVHVTQMGVVYDGTSDWWHKNRAHQELFDNAEALPVTWKYTQVVSMCSKATWLLNKLFMSQKYLDLNIALHFPYVAPQQKCLEVNFSTSENAMLPKSDQYESKFNVSTILTVNPHSSVLACADVYLCQLDNARFMTDIQMEGKVCVLGHKKRKFGKKQEIKCNIIHILQGLPGFEVVDLGTVDEDGDAKKALVYRVEGICTGQVGKSADAVLESMQTLV